MVFIFPLQTCVIKLLVGPPGQDAKIIKPTAIIGSKSNKIANEKPTIGNKINWFVNPIKIAFGNLKIRLKSSNIELTPVTDDLDEVIITGYGSQRKATITGAVSSLKGGDLVKSPAVDITNSLSGRIPGIVVRQSSGEPGFDGSRGLHRS